MIWFIIMSSFLVAPTPAAAAAAAKSMFVFGDANFDTGNNNYINSTIKANFFPYGISFFASPTGRYSDGRLIPDFLANYANMSFIPPFLQPGEDGWFQNGVNFASGGSGALAETFQGGVIDLNTQLNNYKKLEAIFRNKLGNGEAIKRFSEAVYLFSFGTNDYSYIYLTNSTFLTSYSKSQFVDMVISNITSVVREVYKTGGRKFGFLNLHRLLGCVPGLRILTTDGDCVKEASSYAIIHNEALLHALELLAKELPRFVYSVLDLNACLQRRIDHPSQYGYKETRAACCGSGKQRGEFSCGGKRGIQEFQLCDNRNDYIFWDAFHYTQKLSDQCASEMWNTPTKNGSYTIKDLFDLP